MKCSSIDSAAATEELETTGLSNDLVAEIIVKLPFNSVARSNCVSKNWCATISHHSLRRRLPLHMSAVYFRDDPACSSGPRFACAANHDGHLLEDCDLGFFPFWQGAVVCDACNGLLLCRTPGTPRFYVVNPVTRRCAALPVPAKDALLSMLAFDPLSSPHYHVINFTGWRDREAAAEVFSSDTRSWTVGVLEFGVPAAVLTSSTRYHEGAMYILASDPAHSVVRIDVAAAGFACAVIELPEAVDSKSHVAHSCGRLHYVTTDRGWLKVWALENSSPTGQWQLKHTVIAEADDVVKEECTGGEARFLALHPEREAAYMGLPSKIVEYDLSKKKISGAWEFGKDEKGVKNRVAKAWLVPSSSYLSDCLAHGH